MIVGKLFGVGKCAGRMAELNIGIFLCGAEHVGLVTEGVGEDDLAAALGKLDCGGVADIAFGNVGLHYDLFVLEVHCLLDGESGVNEVLVVGGVFIVQEDEADLEIVRNGEVDLQLGSGKDGVGHSFVFAAVGAGAERNSGAEKHNESKQYR